MSLVFHPRSHRYRLDGDWVPGVTTLIGKGLPKPALPYWAARTVAEWVVENPDLTEEIKRLGGGRPAVAFLKELPWQKRDEAAIRGTDIHALAERLVHGEEVAVPEHLATRVQGYVDWLDAAQPEVLLTERACASRQWGYAGTFDAIVTFGGVRYLLDWKTSSGVHGDMALQLSAYSHAEFYLDADGAEQPMPAVDRLGIVHITEEGTTLWPVPADAMESAWKDFLHVAWVGRSADRIKSYIPKPTDPTDSEETAA